MNSVNIIRMTFTEVPDEQRHGDSLRPFLKRGVARMSLNAGFEMSDNDALETVVELYASLLQSIAETTKNYCELGSRTVPLVQDVVSATTDLGIDLHDAVQNLIAAQRNSDKHYSDENIVSTVVLYYRQPSHYSSYFF